MLLCWDWHNSCVRINVMPVKESYVWATQSFAIPACDKLWSAMHWIHSLHTAWWSHTVLVILLALDWPDVYAGSVQNALLWSCFAFSKENSVLYGDALIYSILLLDRFWLNINYNPWIICASAFSLSPSICPHSLPSPLKYPLPLPAAPPPPPPPPPPPTTDEVLCPVLRGCNNEWFCGTGN